MTKKSLVNGRHDMEYDIVVAGIFLSLFKNLNKSCYYWFSMWVFGEAADPGCSEPLSFWAMLQKAQGTSQRARGVACNSSDPNLIEHPSAPSTYRAMCISRTSSEDLDLGSSVSELLCTSNNGDQQNTELEVQIPWLICLYEPPHMHIQP